MKGLVPLKRVVDRSVGGKPDGAGMDPTDARITIMTPMRNTVTATGRRAGRDAPGELS